MNKISILWCFLAIFIACCIVLTFIFNAVEVRCSALTQKPDQNVMCIVDTGTKDKGLVPRKFKY